MKWLGWFGYYGGTFNIICSITKKYGIENKNGRIYPEHILRREAKRL
jgi:hypothetical protein